MYSKPLSCGGTDPLSCALSRYADRMVRRSSSRARASFVRPAISTNAPSLQNAFHMAFAREREKRPRVELLSCGGRLDPPAGSEVFEALETTTCADAGDFENDGVRRARLDPEEETPRFGKCLFARKFADDASRDFTREWGNAIGT